MVWLLAAEIFPILLTAQGSVPRLNYMTLASYIHMSEFCLFSIHRYDRQCQFLL